MVDFPDTATDELAETLRAAHDGWLDRVPVHWPAFDVETLYHYSALDSLAAWLDRDAS